MNDVEHDLRELFDRKASSVGGVAPRLPERVRQRSRRRELGTAVVSGLTALAVVVGTVGVIRAVDTGGDRQPTPADDPWAGYKVFERTATVGNFTITIESDWYLVRPATEGLCGGEEPCEALQLSNFDPGLDQSVCDQPLPPDGVAMVVASALDLNPRNVPAWPTIIEDPNTVGRCGEGRYFHFLDEGNRYPYTAWLGQGPAAQDRELTRLRRSFQDMRIEPTALAAMGRAAYVIAGGKNAAGPWRLELTPSTSDGSSANVELTVVSPEGGAGAGDFTVPTRTPIEQAGGDPVFGAVTKEAAGVELRLEDGTPPIPAQIFPLPPSMPFGFDLFFASNDGDVQATAVALGLGQPAEPTSPAPTVPASMETMEGQDPVPWKLNMSLQDERPCVDFDAGRADFAPWCADSIPSNEPYVRVWSSAGLTFAIAIAPAPLGEVRLERAGRVIQQGSCHEGPGAWRFAIGCVLPLTDLEDGSIVFSSADDEVLIQWPMDDSRQLPWLEEGGGAVVATGASETWRVEQLLDEPGLRVDVGGRMQSFEQPALDEPIVLSYPDRPYDALVALLTDTSVDQVDVASEGRWYGRWMPSVTAGGDEARLWIIELPGAGGGGLSYDGRHVGPVRWP
jgi:hypothetical protein